MELGSIQMPQCTWRHSMEAQVSVGFASPSTAGQATHHHLHLSLSSGQQMHCFSGEMPGLCFPHISYLLLLPES